MAPFPVAHTLLTPQWPDFSQRFISFYLFHFIFLITTIVFYSNARDSSAGESGNGKFEDPGLRPTDTA